MAYCRRGIELMKERDETAKSARFKRSYDPIARDMHAICGGSSEELSARIDWEIHLENCEFCYWTQKEDRT